VICCQGLDAGGSGEDAGGFPSPEPATIEVDPLTSLGRWFDPLTSGAQ